jgi:hypothetical protein
METKDIDKTSSEGTWEDRSKKAVIERASVAEASLKLNRRVILLLFGQGK